MEFSERLLLVLKERGITQREWTGRGAENCSARYEEIKSLVADIYYEYGITHLPVEPFRLAEKMQFVVHEYGDFDEDEQNTIS